MLRLSDRPPAVRGDLLVPRQQVDVGRRTSVIHVSRPRRAGLNISGLLRFFAYPRGPEQSKRVGTEAPLKLADLRRSCWVFTHILLFLLIKHRKRPITVIHMPK